MKVYAIKNDKGQYQTPDMDFSYTIWLADIFDDYEVAKCYCGSDCNVVECELIEKNEIADYTKQVRKEVLQEIYKEFETRLMNKTEDMSVMKVANMINSVLDQIQ